MDLDDVVVVGPNTRGGREYEIVALDGVDDRIQVLPIHPEGPDDGPLWVGRTYVRVIQPAARRVRCPECGIDLERVDLHCEPCPVGLAEQETLAGLDAAVSLTTVAGCPVVSIRLA